VGATSACGSPSGGGGTSGPRFRPKPTYLAQTGLLYLLPRRDRLASPHTPLGAASRVYSIAPAAPRRAEREVVAPCEFALPKHGCGAQSAKRRIFEVNTRPLWDARRGQLKSVFTRVQLILRHRRGTCGGRQCLSAIRRRRGAHGVCPSTSAAINTTFSGCRRMSRCVPHTETRFTWRTRDRQPYTPSFMESSIGY